METIISIALLSAMGIGHFYFGKLASDLIASLPDDERGRIEGILHSPAFGRAV